MVNKTLLLPQEIEAFYILPAIRSALATHLKKKGMNQTQIAELMQINKSAVSQYIHEKRGNKVQFPHQVITEIHNTIPFITNKLTYLFYTQRLLHFIRTNEYLCALHKQVCDVPEGCNPQLVGCTSLKGGCAWKK